MQEIYIGIEKISKLDEIINKIQPKEILLVTGSNSFEKSGAKNLLMPILDHYKIILFEKNSGSPEQSEIDQGVESMEKKSVQLIIAVGGGSVLDTAKLINFQCLKVPLIAIPTTAGSGAESTHFAVVYKNKTKYSIADETILPNYVFLFPELIYNLPKQTSATAGFDALAQGIESFWSINSNRESERLSEQAIKICFNYLKPAVCDHSVSAMQQMQIGANLSGQAINISRTTAPHAISYPMTSYFNIVHGQAVALTLSEILKFNFGITEIDCNDKRGVQFVKNKLNKLLKIICANTAQEASEKLKTLAKDIDLQTKLGEVGIDSDEKIELILKHGFNSERMKNNPRKITRDDLNTILFNLR